MTKIPDNQGISLTSGSPNYTMLYVCVSLKTYNDNHIIICVIKHVFLTKLIKLLKLRNYMYELIIKLTISFLIVSAAFRKITSLKLHCIQCYPISFMQLFTLHFQFNCSSMDFNEILLNKTYPLAR